MSRRQRDLNHHVQTVNKQGRHDTSDATSDVDSEGFHTPLPIKEQEWRDSDGETQFIMQLASMLKEAPDINQKKEDQTPVVDGYKAEDEHSQSDSDHSSKSQNTSMASTTPNEMEVEREDNPQSINLANVMEMFREIKNDIAAARKESKQHIKKEIKEVKKQSVQDIKKLLDKHELQQVKSVKAELDYWKIRSETLSEVCNRMSGEIADLTTRIDNLEMNNAKKMVIISGLSMDKITDKKDGLFFLNNFLDQAIQVQVRIDDYFMLGSGSVKSVVLIFQTIEDKLMVLHYKSLLNETNYPGGKNIYINDYLPPTALDKRRREQDIVNSENKQAISYTKSGLCVNGRPYRKQVTPPTPRELINILPADLTRILTLPTRRSHEIIQEDSIFVAYSAKVQNHQQVKDLYLKIKMIQPNAKHVVCAYVLPEEADDQEKCFNMDYHDDGEANAGRLLLDLLINNKQNGVAVFVARKYGSIKLGASRFTCYLNATKDCLEIVDQAQQDQNTSGRPAIYQRARQYNPRHQRNVGRQRKNNSRPPFERRPRHVHQPHISHHRYEQHFPDHMQQQQPNVRGQWKSTQTGYRGQFNTRGRQYGRGAVYGNSGYQANYDRPQRHNNHRSDAQHQQQYSQDEYDWNSQDDQGQWASDANQTYRKDVD